MIRITLPIVAVAGALIVAPTPVRAQDDSTETEPTVLFASHAPLELRIEAPMQQLIDDIGDDRDEHDGMLYYDDGMGNTGALDVKLRTRGNFRRQRRVCRFPPIRLNVRKGEVTGTLFANQDRLKLVTHCQTDREEYEQYTLEEYLIYRAYNLLTPFSLQVRLAHVTYVDTARADSVVKFGFLIEDEEEFAARFQSEILDLEGVHPSDIDPDGMALIDVFEYFIGNTDWGVVALHNIVLVQNNFLYFAVPYDFDLAGVISTPYARPDGNLPIRRVRDRLYRGYCRSAEELQFTLDLFMENREAIVQLYESFPYLTEERRQRALEYYEEFYEIIQDPGRIRNEFVRNCRG